ncbi:MAG: MFS transporter [Pseudomonadota bacterium]|nr:MFS transporter [Pseudomonadota bacterium]
MKNKKYYSWVLYDWANSAYATIVLAGFFPIIYAEYFASSIESSERTLYLGISNSVASLLLIISAPLFGLLADRFNKKKLFLTLFAFISIVSTFFLSFISSNSFILASILFSISLLGFMMSNVFYDSMLLDFENDKFNRISSYGYAFGYLGGGIAFVIALMFLYYTGHSNMELIASKKIVFIFTSIWWLLFMIPLIIFWKDDKKSEKLTLSIIQSFRELFSNKKIFYFLLAYWVYIDGVDTVIRMAVNYGLTLGFSSSDLLVALLVTQFVSFPGTLLILKISDSFSIEKAIMFCLLVYLGITYLAYNLHSAQQFYIIAVLIGFAQGGIQALSRSYYASLIPRNRSSEYFGIYNMLGKFAALLGPIVVGLVTFYTSDSRIGIASIAIFFIVGMFLFNVSHRINAEK